MRAYRLFELQLPVQPEQFASAINI